MGSTLEGRSWEEALGALWNWFNAPQQGHLMDRAVKMPSPSLRRQEPHLISFIASRFPWVKHPIDSPHSDQGGGPCRLAGCFCRLGLGQVLAHLAKSPVFYFVGTSHFWPAL